MLSLMSDFAILFATYQYIRYIPRSWNVLFNPAVLVGLLADLKLTNGFFTIFQLLTNGQ